MGSPQSLSEHDRRVVAAWAADCAEHVLDIYEHVVPDDDRPRLLIERARSFARGELDTAGEIRRRFQGGVGADEVTDLAARAAARAAGQACAVSHMGAHALGAAGYAAQAASLAPPRTLEDEMRWQLACTSPAVRSALLSLPKLGENRSGPLGPGLLSRGAVGDAIRSLQEQLTQRRSPS